MKSSIIQVTYSSKPSFPMLRKVIAFILLFLVSLSFIIEHLPFVEGDVLELVENSEKEAKKTKDKKVFFSPLLAIYLHSSDLQMNEFAEQDQSTLISVWPDILTPPPRQV